MIPVSILACFFLQGESVKKVPDAALFDELIRKTNDLKAFVAEYRLVEGEHELKFLFTYRAPGEMKAELAGHMSMSFRNGVVEYLGSGQRGKTVIGRLAATDLTRERNRPLTEEMHTEFPSSESDWAEQSELSPFVSMRISPGADSETENFQLMLGYNLGRSTTLGWLETLKGVKNVRFGSDDDVVYATPRGRELTVSTRTGFIESFKKAGSHEGDPVFRLEKLDLDPQLNGESFQLPDPEPDAQDSSMSLAAEWERRITIDQRSSVFRWAASQIAGEKIRWDAAGRAHLKNVLEVIHSGGIMPEKAEWIADTKKWMEGFGGMIHDAYSALEKGDLASRESLDAKIRGTREELRGNMEGMLHDRLSNLSIDAADVPDAELRKSFGDIEEAAVVAAFKQVLEDPLLESFDDCVEKAKAKN